MPDEAVEKVMTGEAWNEFCDLLKQAGNVLLREDLETDAFDRGEGHRYLARLLRAGLFSFGELSGTENPKFRKMPEGIKLGLDNPDNYYVSASVSPQYSYRIRGNRRTIHYLSFAAQDQNFAAKDKISGGAGHLNDSELEIAADGTFEIIASTKEHPGNWLRMTEQTKQILVRQTFLHRDTEQAVDLDIECLESEGPPPPLDPARVPGMLMGGALYAIGASVWFADWVVDFLQNAPMNDFHLPEPEKHRVMGGDPNIRMFLGRWELGPDEALVIETMPPKCHYWNFQLGNIWAESLDYDFRRVHVNNGQAKYRGDGSFQLVVAHEDPGGVDNWIDTAGHRHGTMALRYVRTDGYPSPDVKVVPVSELERS